MSLGCWTYLVVGERELFEVVNEFEYLVMMDFSDGRRVVEEHHLDLRSNQLLLFQILADNLKALLQLHKNS